MKAIDWFAGLALTGAATAAGAIYLSHHRAPFTALILATGLVIGPGTWMALLFWRRRGRESAVCFAALLNILFTTGAIIAGIVINLWADLPRQ